MVRLGTAQCVVLALVWSGCSLLAKTDVAQLDPADDQVDGGARPDGSIGEEEGGDGPSGGCDSEPSCVDGTFSRCVDGEVQVTECAIGCSEKGARCLETAPSNVDDWKWLETHKNVTITGDADYDTGTCSGIAPGVPALRMSQGDGLPQLCVIAVKNFEIPSGASLTVRGRRPLVILAAGDVSIQGELDGSSFGPLAGPGGAPGGSVLSGSAEGPGALGGGGGASYQLMSGGGGGGALCGDGGRGADDGEADGGEGATAIDDSWKLDPLFGGGGGGAGAPYGEDKTGGWGGGGGGAIQISARGTIEIGASGSIRVGGGGGRGGVGGGGDAGGGGGGGAGGAILLEGVMVTVDGSLIAAGGGGGGGAFASSGDAGGNGAFVSTTRAPGGGGSGPAGDGAAGSAPDMFGGEDADEVEGNGGGGGGGSGCVLVRSAQDPSLGDAVLHPSAADAFRSDELLTQ